MQTINSTLSILNSSFLQSLVIKIIGLGIIWFGITSNFLFHRVRDCWGQERFQSAQSPTSSPKRRGNRCRERQRPWPSHRQLEAKPATLSNYNALCPFKRSHLRKCHSPGHNTVVLQDPSRQILRVQDVPELSIYSQALLKTEELVTLGL